MTRTFIWISHPLDIIPTAGAEGEEQDNVKEPKDEGSIQPIDSVDNELGVNAEAEVNWEENISNSGNQHRVNQYGSIEKSSREYSGLIREFLMKNVQMTWTSWTNQSSANLA